MWKSNKRIIGREGAEVRVSGLFFKSVVQAVLLSSSDTWVVTPPWDGPWGGFQDQVPRRLTGQLLRQELDGKRMYTSAVRAREEAEFQTMEEYI